MKSRLIRFILAVSLGVIGVILIEDALTMIGVMLLIWSNNIPTGDLQDEK